MDPKSNTLADLTGWFIALARQALDWFSRGCEVYLAWSDQYPIWVIEQR